MEQDIDITKMTVIELKALAYDELAKQQVCQQNLQIINQEIVKRQSIEPMKEQQ